MHAQQSHTKEPCFSSFNHVNSYFERQDKCNALLTTKADISVLFPFNCGSHYLGRYKGIEERQKRTESRRSDITVLATFSRTYR